MTNNFISNARLKLEKSKQVHPEAEFFFLKIIHILHPCYNPKLIGHIQNNKQRNSESVFARSFD